MPRQARLEAPGMVHHVILRGIKRGQIVAGREDRKSFLGRLGLSLADTVRQLGVSTSGIAKSGRRSGATISPLSQRRPASFGAGLPDDEVRYLHALIVRALGALDGRRW
jgi:hypothetical protein